MLFLSLSNFFFPTVYAFYDRSFKVRSLWGTREYKYNRFRYLKTAQNGIFLSPYPRAVPLDFIRGVFILMDKDQVREAADLIRGRLAGVPGEETPDA
ncbi:MAG: hypothetical protein M1269_04940 [Chloroflexi bacterium]|nr:hypothetical protein [Chloroflexota bacterium]